MVQGGINSGRSRSGNKFDFVLEERRGWFRIINVKETKKVASILRLGKKDSFLDLE
jgi:hypothetical protein